MASLYKRGNVFWVCYMDHGRKFDKSLKTKDKRVAQYRVNEIEIKIAKGDDPLPDLSISAREAFEEFKKSRTGRIVVSTENTDNYRIDHFLNSGISRLVQITEPRLKEYLDKRIKDDGISHRTANHTIRIIKTFLTWAVRTNRLSKNPIAHMQRYKVNQKEPRFLTADQARQVLEKSEGSRIHLVVALAIYTGMRMGEIMRLEWKDFDFENRNVIVRLSKPGKFRKIPMHRALQKIMLKHRQASGLMYAGTVRTVEWDFLLIKRELPEIENFRFHDLRHTFASLLIKAGVDIYTVSKLLGHAQITTTQIYAHLYQEHVQEAIQKLKV